DAVQHAFQNGRIERVDRIQEALIQRESPCRRVLRRIGGFNLLSDGRIHDQHEAGQYQDALTYEIPPFSWDIFRMVPFAHDFFVHGHSGTGKTNSYPLVYTGRHPDWKYRPSCLRYGFSGKNKGTPVHSDHDYGSPLRTERNQTIR